MYHIPVLLSECIEGLSIRPEGTYVDVTYGSGQHSAAVLAKLTTGKLFAFDCDPDALQNLLTDERFHFIPQNFRFLKNFLKIKGISHIDGLLADLGISSWQIDQPERGFSTRFDGTLDMRMDQQQGQDAQDIINSYSEEELARMFREFGEITNAGQMAREIINSRNSREIKTTGELKEVILRNAPRGRENQYLARAFQAIRIEVNEELESLKTMLAHATDILRPGGRIAVITYHSLEDRLVKNYFKSGNFEGIQVKDFFGHLKAPLRPVNRKPIVPLDREIQENPRSRSAKLRIAEKN